MWVTQVQSRTNPKVRYEVRVHYAGRASCDCWKYRKTGECHHLEPALAAYYIAMRRQEQDKNLSTIPEGWRPILGRKEQEEYELETFGETIFDRMQRLKEMGLPLYTSREDVP